jgi:hypothetical protein
MTEFAAMLKGCKRWARDHSFQACGIERHRADPTEKWQGGDGIERRAIAGGADRAGSWRTMTLARWQNYNCFRNLHQVLNTIGNGVAPGRRRIDSI